MAAPNSMKSLWMLPLAAVLSVPAAQAKTWTVSADGSGDVPSIQAGINAASDGDVVHVLAGLYNENIDFLGKAITVEGSGMSSTAINAVNMGAPVVVFSQGEGRSSVLKGFTLSGGAGLLVDGTRYGGGVYILDAEPTVRENRIVHNFLDGASASYGGGIYCGVTEGQALRSALIEGNVIDENSAATAGGGIAVGNLAAPVLRDNTLSQNMAGRGGAISYSGPAAQPLIEGNRIEWNLAGTVGGGISGQDAGTSEISGNILAFNVAGGIQDHEGSAIHLENASAQIRQNTLVKNRINGTQGGTVVLDGCPDVVVERNLFCYSVSGSGLLCLASTSTIRNNLLWENADGEDVGDCSNWDQGEGNIVADPVLCGMNDGDFRPSSDSPALHHPSGPLGAFSAPGCGTVATQETTWGSLKARFDSASQNARN